MNIELKDFLLERLQKEKRENIKFVIVYSLIKIMDKDSKRREALLYHAKPTRPNPDQTFCACSLNFRGRKINPAQGFPEQRPDSSVRALDKLKSKEEYR